MSTTCSPITATRAEYQLNVIVNLGPNGGDLGNISMLLVVGDIALSSRPPLSVVNGWVTTSNF